MTKEDKIYLCKKHKDMFVWLGLGKPQKVDSKEFNKVKNTLFEHEVLPGNEILKHSLIEETSRSDSSKMVFHNTCSACITESEKLLSEIRLDFLKEKEA